MGDIDYKTKAAELLNEIEKLLLETGCKCSRYGSTDLSVSRECVETRCEIKAWSAQINSGWGRRLKGVKVWMEKVDPNRYGYHGSKTLIKQDGQFEPGKIAAYILNVLKRKTEIAAAKYKAKIEKNELERLAAEELGDSLDRLSKCTRHPDGTYTITLCQYSLTLAQVRVILEILKL